MENTHKVLYDILVQRLECLRQLDAEGDSPLRRHIAAETSRLHAQLAHRLGLYQIKTEMEDLALKFTNYDIYKYIARALNEKKSERDAYIERFITPIKACLEKEGFKFTIKGRPKSIHSIYHKMQAQHCDVDRIYDLFAIRIILDSPLEREKTDCWQVYSLITDIFPPNPKRLRDWLSAPKENGYESLHTTVLGPDNKWVEVQIRTERMDQIAEKGIAAHWAYKGVSANKTAIGQNSVFVFTPTGDLRRLPNGARVLDFAYSIHTDVGSHCTGGLINEQIVSIKQKLNNGDTVKILTSPNQHPTQDWLNIVVSNKAKSKIKQSLKEIEYKNATAGREMLERRLHNWKLDYNENTGSMLALRLGYKEVSDMYQSIANGKEDLQHIKDIYISLSDAASATPIHNAEKPSTPTFDNTSQALAVEVDMNVKGVDFNLSTCCNPKPGDDIFAFVSVTKGIRIHRCDCPNAANMLQKYRYRILPARWVNKGGNK